MKLVKQILANKGSQVWSISPDAMMFEALKLMAEKEVGALLVLKDGRIHGIVSERDYARKIILHGKSSKETKVEEIMTSNVICISPDTHVDECMAIMIDKKVRHLPVEDKDGNLLGIISIGDVVKAVIDNKEYEIEELIRYIQGTPK